MVFEARTIVTKEIGRDHQVSIVMEESDKDSTPNASAGDLQPGNECSQGTNAARERMRPGNECGQGTNAARERMRPGNECGQGTNAARERLRPEDMFRRTFTWN